MKETQQPLDRAFNVAVNQIANRLFPTGFDVGAEAPDSLLGIVAHVKATGRMLVWNGASSRTIFADPETNYAFRAWHDWCHWRGNLPFTLEGERQAAAMQMDHVRTLFGDGPIARRFCRLIEAEVIGQAECYARTGGYPLDQRAFTVSYLTETA